MNGLFAEVSIGRRGVLRALVGGSTNLSFSSIAESVASQVGANTRPAPDLAFVGVNIVPMTGPEVVHEQTVLVRQGRIAAIGPKAELMTPSGVMVIDGRGGWLMPGLSDMHVHLSDTPQALDLFVANGVTTIRELNGQPDYLIWAKQIEARRRLGPRLASTGPILNSKAGSGFYHDVAVNTPEQARAAVLAQWRAGFRIVKVYTGLNLETYEAAVVEAKHHGMYVTGHIPDSAGLDGVIAAGQDEIAHIEELRAAFMVGYDPQRPFRRYAMDASRIPAVVEKVAKAGLTVCTSLTTLQALYDQSADTAAVLARPEIAYQLPFWTNEMRKEDYFFSHRLPADYVGGTILPFFRNLMVALQQAGVRLIAGTDSGLPGIVWGWGVHQELQLLVQAGLTPYQALRAATVAAAEVLPESGSWGRIRAGASADLLLVDGNPLEDIRNTHRIRGVTRGGRWLDRGRCAALLEAARTEIARSTASVSLN